MNLQSYYKIKNILQQESTTKEERRTFALKNKLPDLTHKKQLLFWMNSYDNESKTENFSLSSIKNILLLITSLLGFFSAVALLSYSGDKPVNVIYFFTLAVVVPLFSMGISIFALFFEKAFTPLFLTTWLQKILVKLFTKQHLHTENSLEASYLLFLVQLASLFFSLGLLGGFLLTILTQDIAFGWSTTLQIPTADFYEFLHTLSFAFKDICPQSSISLELIEKSHYFRLGQNISATMQENAALFGQWWKFLACSTLFYAIFLRLIFVAISYMKLQRDIEKKLFINPEVKQLLKDMNEPFISRKATQKEITSSVTTQDLAPAQEANENYFALLGWSFSEDELLLYSDDLQLHAKHHYTLGGNKSLKEESAIIQTLQGEILLLIKAWEIPTMEFIDTLEAIVSQSQSVVIYPLGYAKNSYRANPKDVALWEQKIATQNFENVSIKV